MIHSQPTDKGWKIEKIYMYIYYCIDISNIAGICVECRPEDLIYILYSPCFYTYYCIDIPNIAVRRCIHISITSSSGWHRKCTHREILLNQIEINLLFCDWFGTKQTSNWFKINRKMVNTVLFRVDLIRFRKDFFVCTIEHKYCVFVPCVRRHYSGKMVSY